MKIDRKLVVIGALASACGLGGAGVAEADESRESAVWTLMQPVPVQQPTPGCNEWVDSWRGAVPDWATEHHDRLNGWCEQQLGDDDPPIQQERGEEQDRTINVQ
ncbi:MAG: hypothetical protein WAW17_20430 [Rhodococcus sp. (in: high G+C Gram-positive bacteria)]|uniref:hypothetical protein n=1 Tax=Rhodococcus sp. TaxID=1831 RepID=UPI003BB00FF1